jgi:hypothetical protein
MSLITCGAASGVCVLAWSGGVILGCVILVTHLVGCAELCVGECVSLISDSLQVRTVCQHGWWHIACPLNCWKFFLVYANKHPLFFIFHPLFWCWGGGLPVVYASRCFARSFRTLRDLALHPMVSKFFFEFQ